MFSNTPLHSRGRSTGLARPQGARHTADAHRHRADLLAVTLREEVQPTCSICDCAMESWDLYYDHLIFDRDHQANAERVLAERTSRPKPDPGHADGSPVESPTEPSRSALLCPRAALERHAGYTVSPIHRTSCPLPLNLQK